LDAFISENKTKNDKLNEMQIRLEIMKRDDLSGQEVNEKEIEEEIEKNIGMRGLESARKWRGSSSDKGKALIEKFIFVKKVLEKLIEKKEEEDEMRRILEAKITQLKLDQVTKYTFCIE